MELAELVIRLSLSFFVLLTLARIMGRKEISQMTFFNLISAITIGTIGGSLVTDNALSIRNGVLALVGWSIFTVLMGFIDIKSKSMRKLIEGDPIIVIKNGKIMDKELRKARLDIDALNAKLREKNVFAISDVEYAIFETDGKLSVMKTENKKTVTKGDMANSSTTPSIYPIATEVISDGEIITKNLSSLNLDQKWLEQQLQQSGIESVSEVFYAEVNKDGSLYIDRKGDMVH